MKSFVTKNIFAISIGILILIVSIIPTGRLPRYSVDYADKIVHVVMYLILYIAMTVDFFIQKKTIMMPTKHLWGLALVAILYGGGVELLQWFLPYRSASIYDFIANAIGVLICLFIVLILSLLKRKFI